MIIISSKTCGNDFDACDKLYKEDMIDGGSGGGGGDDDGYP